MPGQEPDGPSGVAGVSLESIEMNVTASKSVLHTLPVFLGYTVSSTLRKTRVAHGGNGSGELGHCIHVEPSSGTTGRVAM